MSSSRRQAVIITALPIERTAVIEHLQGVSEEPPLSGSIYRRGIFHESSDPWDVVVAEIEAGNVRASAEAERVISHYSPEIAVFVGVAGAIKDLKHGDVVASTKVFGYESGKDEEDGLKTRPAVTLPGYQLEERARFEAGQPDWRQRIKPVGQSSQKSEPNAKVAPIASGEKVVASNRSKAYKFIREHYGDAVAVEMEGHGFLLGVAMNHPTQGIVVRGISDLVDDKDEANDETWQPIAARHAAAFAFQILAKHTGPGEGGGGPALAAQLDSTPTLTTHLQADWRDRHKLEQPLAYRNSVVAILWCELDNAAAEDDRLHSILTRINRVPSANQVQIWDRSMAVLFPVPGDAAAYALDLRDIVLNYDWYHAGSERPPFLRTYIAIGRFSDFTPDPFDEELFPRRPEIGACRQVSRTEPVMVFLWNQRQTHGSLSQERLFMDPLPGSATLATPIFRIFRSQQEHSTRPIYDDQYYRRERVLRRFSYLWLRLDQLPAGSWGRSVSPWMRNIWRNCPECPPWLQFQDHMEEEGGFETTILTLDILSKIHGPKDFFYDHFKGSPAAQYLETRMDADGGIGPKSFQRIGPTIQSAARHTALALWFFAEDQLRHGLSRYEDLFGRGIRFLFLSNFEDVKTRFVKDKNPVALYMSCWHLVRLIRDDQHVANALSPDEVRQIPRVWADIEGELLARALQSRYRPLPSCVNGEQRDVWGAADKAANLGG